MIKTRMLQALLKIKSTVKKRCFTMLHKNGINIIAGKRLAKYQPRSIHQKQHEQLRVSVTAPKVN